MRDGMLALRMERQCLTRPATEAEYPALYRDLQPGQNVYWNGFGDPPSLTFRADFDDIAFNRERQARRELIKGRFAGGNLGWIVPEDLTLFASLYRKPLDAPSPSQTRILELIEREGPLTIQQMKETTGYLVKEITPILHRLQEAFLIYEDQYDGGWDRGWYRFGECFPDAEPGRFTRHEALKRILPRFAYRMVRFDTAMAKGFYRLPEKELRAAADELVADGVFVRDEDGYLLQADAALLEHDQRQCPRAVFAIHRNDVLYRTQEQLLKKQLAPLLEGLPYDHEPLQYLLIDGEFHGACVGHFRNGPYDLNDIVCDLPNAAERADELLDAVRRVNHGRCAERLLGKALTPGGQA